MNKVESVKPGELNLSINVNTKTVHGVLCHLYDRAEGGYAIRTERGSIPGWYEPDAVDFAVRLAYQFPDALEKFVDNWESPRLITLAELEPLQSWKPEPFNNFDDIIRRSKLYKKGQLIPKKLWRVFFLTLAHHARHFADGSFDSKGKLIKSPKFSSDVRVIQLYNGAVCVLHSSITECSPELLVKINQTNELISFVKTTT